MMPVRPHLVLVPSDASRDAEHRTGSALGTGAPGVRPARPRPLWRERAGGVLRERRIAAGLRLSDVADRAGLSTQYLSEVERGRKEPSSEVLDAACGALGMDLLDLVRAVQEGLAPAPGGQPTCLAA